MATPKEQQRLRMRETALHYAKEELAERYVENIKALESSENPLTTLKELQNGQTRSKEIDSIKTYPVYMNGGFENHPDAKEALRALAEKELSQHHQEEQTTLQAKHASDLGEALYLQKIEQIPLEEYDRQVKAIDEKFERDQKILTSLHRREADLFEKSETPLQDTRQVTQDSARYESFEHYVSQRIDAEKDVQELENMEAPKTEAMTLSDSENHIRAHLKHEAQNQAITEPPPYAHSDYVVTYMKDTWPKMMITTSIDEVTYAYERRNEKEAQSARDYIDVEQHHMQRNVQTHLAGTHHEVENEAHFDNDMEM